MMESCSCASGSWLRGGQTRPTWEPVRAGESVPGLRVGQVCIARGALPVDALEADTGRSSLTGFREAAVGGDGREPGAGETLCVS